jgi:transcription factor IIIB subunit 2
VSEFVIKPYEAPDELNLSDLDEDDEVHDVILAEDEIELKTRIWSTLNEDYLKAEAEKERIAAIAAKTEAVKDDGSKAESRVAESHVAVPRKRAPRGPRKAAPKPVEPASTAADAAKQMMTTKRLSKKINYEALDSLFDR